jgi:hypothetical protein
MLTQERLKELISYDPETGLFSRKINTGKSRYGDSFGNLDSKGYLRGCIDWKEYRLHRLAFLYMTGNLPKGQVDHINRNRTDNRWVNLREVTQSENNRNSPIKSNNKSGIIGVDFRKDFNKWRASATLNGKHIHLGLFSEKADAIAARTLFNNKHCHPNHGKTVCS